MPNNPTLPLTQATAIVDSSLCDIKSTQDILDLVVENVVVLYSALASAVNSQVIFSPTPPTGDNFGKIWVKTTGGGSADPRGIGIVVNGQYVILPIPADANAAGVPSGGIIIWPNSTPPTGWAIFAGTPPVGQLYIQKL